MTAKEVAQNLTLGDVPKGAKIVIEISKSLRKPRPKKDKQGMVLVRVSLWNSLCTKLSMEEKGKVVNIATDEEEEDLQDLVIAEEEDEGMEVDTQPLHSAKKGRLKCPRTSTRPRARSGHRSSQMALCLKAHT